MREYQKLSEPSVSIVYSSPYYTVACAAVAVQVGKNGASRFLVAEGIARRSWKDPHKLDIGEHIAKGRAITALNAKCTGKRVWPRIKTATDLLSNG
jgi:hypothetical protein